MEPSAWHATVEPSAWHATVEPSAWQAPPVSSGHFIYHLIPLKAWKKWERANVVLYISSFLSPHKKAFKGSSHIFFRSSRWSSSTAEELCVLSLDLIDLEDKKYDGCVLWPRVEQADPRRHGLGFVWNALPRLLSALGKETDLFLSETANWPQRISINTPYRNEYINDQTQRKMCCKIVSPKEEKKQNCLTWG